MDYTLAADGDLEEILDLQRQNVEEALSPAEALSQGFVTVRHDLPLLLDMNRAAPHVVARSGGRVAGYALVMLPEFEDRIPVLAPMCERLRRLEHRGRPVSGQRYFIMGQVCVARGFRGRGVLAGMYGEMRKRYRDRYDLVVTEVACRNTRSIRAHARAGFELLHRYRDQLDEWDIVAWDWRDVASREAGRA